MPYKITSLWNVINCFINSVSTGHSRIHVEFLCQQQGHYIELLLSNEFVAQKSVPNFVPGKNLNWILTSNRVLIKTSHLDKKVEENLKIQFKVHEIRRN